MRRVGFEISNFVQLPVVVVAQFGKEARRALGDGKKQILASLRMTILWDDNSLLNATREKCLFGRLAN